MVRWRSARSRSRVLHQRSSPMGSALPRWYGRLMLPGSEWTGDQQGLADTGTSFPVYPAIERATTSTPVLMAGVIAAKRAMEKVWHRRHPQGVRCASRGAAHQPALFRDFIPTCGWKAELFGPPRDGHRRQFREAGKRRILEGSGLQKLCSITIRFGARRHDAPARSLLMQLAAPHQAPGDVGRLQRRAFGR